MYIHINLQYGLKFISYLNNFLLVHNIQLARKLLDYWGLGITKAVMVAADYSERGSPTCLSNIHNKQPPEVISDDGLIFFVLAVESEDREP